MMRILIVDPETSTRDRVHRALAEQLSCAATECSDGATALDALARGTYSLLVTELTLPMMTGIDMLTILRHQPRFRSLPIIVMTGKRDDSLVRRVVSLGVGDYLIKPLNVDRLCARARALTGSLDAPLAGSPDFISPRALPRSGRILMPPLQPGARSLP